MNSNEIINELEKVESKYKDKVFATGELNIYEMVKSCKYKIQELDQENKKLREKLQNISTEFLIYDWKTSNKEQIVNQLESLYNSIFRSDK